MKRRNFMRGALSVGTVAITSAASGNSHFISIQDFWALNFCPPGKVYLRQDINKLLDNDPNHEIVESYKKAVKAMKALPSNVCTSWDYQANIHGTTLPASQWPNSAPFNSCQHNNYAFLPWHRMYLFFFEKIIRKYSGNLNFALPYWNYSKFGQASLPSPFRIPANSNNPLFDGTRQAWVNGGTPLSNSVTNTASALSKMQFLGSSEFSRSLEVTPHGVVHGTIGGNMGNFAGAGRDPIFWLHHCNIDRLWEKWLTQGNRINPVNDTNWMSQTWTFVNECCDFVTMTNADVLHTVSQLRYQYDDPHQCVPLILAELSEKSLHIHEFVEIGETILGENISVVERSKDGVVHISGKSAELSLHDLIQESDVPLFENNGKNTSKISIEVSNIQTDEPLSGYFELYVSLLSNKSSSAPIYVGNISTFGSDKLSRESMKNTAEGADHDQHGETGAGGALDITSALGNILGGADVPEDGVLDVELRIVSGVEDKKADLEVLEALEKTNPVIGKVRLTIAVSK